MRAVTNQGIPFVPCVSCCFQTLQTVRPSKDPKGPVIHPLNFKLSDGLAGGSTRNRRKVSLGPKNTGHPSNGWSWTLGFDISVTQTVDLRAGRRLECPKHQFNGEFVREENLGLPYQAMCFFEPLTASDQSLSPGWAWMIFNRSV